jgi:hypothetical protein
MKSLEFLKTVSLTSLIFICSLLIYTRLSHPIQLYKDASGYGAFIISFLLILVFFSESLFSTSNCSIDYFDNMMEQFNETDMNTSVEQENILPTNTSIPTTILPQTETSNLLTEPTNMENSLSATLTPQNNPINMENSLSATLTPQNNPINMENSLSATLTPQNNYINMENSLLSSSLAPVNNYINMENSLLSSSLAPLNNQITTPNLTNTNLVLPVTNTTYQNNQITTPNLVLPVTNNQLTMKPISTQNNQVTTPNLASTNLVLPVSANATIPKLSDIEITEKKLEENTNFDFHAVTTEEIRALVKEMVKESKHSYLEKEEYKEKDPLYYMNTGDLIDNSWDNQFTVLNTKYWKPYFYDAKPPVCMGNNDNCQANPTTMHTPYLELKDFSKTTIKPAKLVNNDSGKSTIHTQTNKPVGV